MQDTDKVEDSARGSIKAVHAGTVRAGGLMGFSALVSELGGNPKHLLESCGLSQFVIDEADNIIPFTLGARLLHLAAEETRCPHFGLLLGQRQGTVKLGPVGFLMQNSPDVRTAINNLTRYLHLHVQGASVQLTEARGLAQFTYQITIPGVVGAEQVYNLCIANKFNFLKLLCGKDWRPSAVHFCYRAPVDETPFQQFFSVPVHFSQQSTTLIFAPHYLDRPITNADQNLRKVLQDYIAQIEVKHPRDFHGQLRAILTTLLPTGKCSIDAVAALYSMHRRTFHRHLMSYNITFEDFLDCLRREIAEQMLGESALPLSRLASILGYRDTSAFNRAFRRWFDMTPTDWRSSHLKKSP